LVLGTDYDSFTAIYSCAEVLGGVVELAWINTRDPNPTPDVVSIILKNTNYH
jgi:hypothetical protein